MIRRLTGAGLVAAAVFACAPGAAATFTATYVFGDSLSDRGNAAEYLRVQQGIPNQHLPNPPYFHDSFTNGDVAVQVLANKYGRNADASLFTTNFQDAAGLGYTSGTNYAVAGATAADGLGIGQPGGNLSGQVGAYLLHSAYQADPNALYTVFIGGNDVRKATSDNPPGLILTGVATEVAAIQALLTSGVQHLLVVNVPDIGKIPEYALENPGLAGTATANTIAYNQLLTAGLAPVIAVNTQARIYQFNLFGYDTALRAGAGALGITDIIDPCYTSYPVENPFTPLTTSAACGSTNGGTTQAANIGNLYYWDNHHPTAKVQAALGNALYAFVEASDVPEPASWATMVAGFALTGATLRRRRAAAIA